MGDTVRIIETGETGQIKRILASVNGPEFWVPTDADPSKEYSAYQLEPVDPTTGEIPVQKVPGGPELAEPTDEQSCRPTKEELDDAFGPVEGKETP